LIFNGNDTIDRYPLGCGKVEKILCVSERTFKRIVEDFKAFFKGITGQLDRGSSRAKSNEGQDARPKTAARTLTPKSTDYEPTNTIYLQYSAIRRWRRVNEWFRQYAPYGAEEQVFGKGVLGQ